MPIINTPTCSTCHRKVSTSDRLCPYCQQEAEDQRVEDDKLAEALRRLKQRGVLLSILTEEE